MTALDTRPRSQEDTPTRAEAARDGRGETGRYVLLDLDKFGPWLADYLASQGTPVEEAEDEVAGYTERSTGAFIGAHRPRWVGPWEDA